MSDHLEHSIVITGGGTAGHVFPAIALAEALLARGYQRSQISFIGSRRGMEGPAVTRAGFAIRLLPGRGLVRGTLIANVPALCGLGLAVLVCIGDLSRRRPRALVSVGGYASVPAALAAAILRIPIVVVNVDAVAGLSNRIVGRFARHCAVGFSGTGLANEIVTGAPVRASIEEVRRDATSRDHAHIELGIEPRCRLVTIIGGSLGARRLNELGMGVARAFSGRDDLFFVHVVGERNEAEFSESLAREPVGPNYRCLPFFESMSMLYSASDLFVCRSGAMTVAELALTGTPAILFPLSPAPNEHQRKNAEALRAHGAAIVMDDATTVEELVVRIESLLDDPVALRTIEDRARSLGRRGAARAIASLVDNVVHGEPVAFE